MKKEKLKRLRDDPVVFADVVLNFKAFDYQANILRDRSKRIVACMGRQTGKTTTISALAIDFAITHPNTTTLIVSPSLRQSMIMFSRIESFIYASKILRKSIVRKTRTIIQFTNSSMIVALPCSENMLRGYTANLVICDEAAFMPEDVITGVMFPMLATTHGILILLSTPWSRDNLFYRAVMDPKWSVHKIKSSECPLITTEFLEEQRSMMTSEQFAREYEAEFAESVEAYFSQELIRSCVLRAQSIGAWYSSDFEKFQMTGCFAGVDLGKMQDYSVISVIQTDGDLRKLIFHHQFPLETPYPEIVGAIRRMHQLGQFRKIAVDRTGVGVPVVDEMMGLPVDGIMFTAQRKAEMLGHLRILMEQGNLVLPYNRELCAQLNDQRFRYSAAGQLHFWHPEGAHDDRLWSLALAVYAAKGEVAESYVPRGLIESCVVPGDLESDAERWAQPPGQYFCGLDVGKLDDFSVVSVVAQRAGTLELVFQKQFPLKAPYPEIVDVINKLNKKCGFVHLVINRTGVGAAIMEEFPDVRGVEGIHLSVERKADVLGYLKMRMEQKTFKMPSNPDLCEEIAQQRHKLTPWGASRFWPPAGTHDDRLWSLALAVYAAKEKEPEGAVRPAW